MNSFNFLLLCLPYFATCAIRKYGSRSRQMEEVDVKLYIFSEYNPDGDLEILYSNPKDTAVYYDSQKTNVFLIPGSNSYEFEKLVKPALLSTQEANVFLFEWIQDDNVDSQWKEKSIAAAGYLISKFILKLNRTLNLPLENTQLVGEGIGAHLAGEVGKQLKGQLQGIVALDPTFPAAKQISKLEKSDAKVVEVIHTEGTRGYPSSMGTIDFFVNGGMKQPGCEENTNSQKSCSHKRSWIYYVESLKGGIFMGYRCSGYKYVKNLELENCDGTFALLGGLNLSEKPKGDFFVITKTDGPEFAPLDKNMPHRL